MSKRFKLAAATVAALVMVGAIGFYAWTRVASYPAFPEAIIVAERAETADGWYVFEPDRETTLGLVFYPGGLVHPAAYAPLMQRLSDGGVLAVIVPMPLDLAIFGIGRADEVIAAYPWIDSWAVGGHSLGGAMAAEYAKRNPDAVAGIVFLAAYPADSTDLSSLALRAVSTYGSADGVSADVFEASLQRLPDGTDLIMIDGGNHAQFGHYGPQKGDGLATISRVEQQKQTAEIILELFNKIR